MPPKDVCVEGRRSHWRYDQLYRTAQDDGESPGRVVRGFLAYFFLVLIVSTTVVRGFALAVDFFTNRPVTALRATFLVFRAIA